MRNDGAAVPHDPSDRTDQSDQSDQPDRSLPAIKPVSWRTHADQLIALRHAVFVEEQGVPETLEVDAQDPHALHFAALTDTGACVATGRLTAGGKIGRMAVAADWRGLGLGGAMLRRILQAAQQRGDEVYLDAQVTAQDFYRRYGFVAEGEVFDDAGLPHIRMRHRLGDTATARSTGLADRSARIKTPTL